MVDYSAMQESQAAHESQQAMHESQHSVHSSQHSQHSSASAAFLELLPQAAAKATIATTAIDINTFFITDELLNYTTSKIFGKSKPNFGIAKSFLKIFKISVSVI